MGDEFLKDGCKLGLAVDVGCGTGQNTWPLAELFDKVVGVDVSPIAVERSKEGVAQDKLHEYHIQASGGSQDGFLGGRQR